MLTSSIPSRSSFILSLTDLASKQVLYSLAYDPANDDDYDYLGQ